MLVRVAHQWAAGKELLLTILGLTGLFVLGILAFSPELNHMIEIKGDGVNKRGGRDCTQARIGRGTDDEP